MAEGGREKGKVEGKGKGIKDIGRSGRERQGKKKEETNGEERGTEKNRGRDREKKE